MGTIVIELCPEDRARLDAIIAGLSGIHSPNCKSCVDSAMHMVANVMQDPEGIGSGETPATSTTFEEPPEVLAAIAEPDPVEEVPAEPEAPATPEPPKAKVIEFPDFQGLVSKVLADGKCTKPQLREHMATYGCKKLSDIPEDKRAEFLAHFGVQA